MSDKLQWFVVQVSRHACGGYGCRGGYWHRIVAAPNERDALTMIHTMDGDAITDVESIRQIDGLPDISRKRKAFVWEAR